MRQLDTPAVGLALHATPKLVLHATSVLCISEITPPEASAAPTHRGGTLQTGLLHQRRDRNIKRRREPNQRKHGDVVVAAFDTTDIAAVDTRQERQIFLADGLRLANPSQRFAQRQQGGVMSLAGQVWHRWIISE